MTASAADSDVLFGTCSGSAMVPASSGAIAGFAGPMNFVKKPNLEGAGVADTWAVDSFDITPLAPAEMAIPRPIQSALIS